MKKRITGISIHQTSKMMACMFFVISLISVLVLIAYLGITSGLWNNWVLLIAPFVYFVFGYVYFAIFTWFYNKIASWAGGIEFTLTDQE